METSQPTILDLRDCVIEKRGQQAHGTATMDELNAAADRYIAALRDYRRRTGKRFAIPSRAYVIRAL